MAHEPSSLQRDAKRTRKLIAGNTLLAGAQQKCRLQPNVQRDRTVFEDGSLSHSELLAAVVALFQAKPFPTFLVLHAMERLDATHATAVRTNRTVRPNDLFETFEGRRFVLKIRFAENG